MLGRLEFIATAGRSIVLEFHNTNKTLLVIIYHCQTKLLKSVMHSNVFRTESSSYTFLVASLAHPLLV
jgi:hypothetical protein